MHISAHPSRIMPRMALHRRPKLAKQIRIISPTTISVHPSHRSRPPPWSFSGGHNVQVCIESPPPAFRRALHADRAPEGYSPTAQVGKFIKRPPARFGTPVIRIVPPTESSTYSPSGQVRMAPPRPFRHTPHAHRARGELHQYVPSGQVRAASPRPFRHTPHAHHAPHLLTSARFCALVPQPPYSN